MRNRDPCSLWYYAPGLFTFVIAIFKWTFQCIVICPENNSLRVSEAFRLQGHFVFEALMCHSFQKDNFSMFLFLFLRHRCLISKRKFWFLATCLILKVRFLLLSNLFQKDNFFRATRVLFQKDNFSLPFSCLEWEPHQHQREQVKWEKSSSVEMTTAFRIGTVRRKMSPN